MKIGQTVAVKSTDSNRGGTVLWVGVVRKISKDPQNDHPVFVSAGRHMCGWTALSELTEVPAGTLIHQVKF